MDLSSAPLEAKPAWPAMGWPFHVCLGGALLLLLYSQSEPVGGFLLFLASVVGLLVAAVVWLVWAVVSGRRRRWTWWLVLAPAVAAGSALLLAAGVPLDLRWALSRDAFAAQVRHLPAAPAAGQPWVALDVPARLSLYHVQEAYRLPGGVAFYTGSSWATRGGFAYLPDGPPASLEDRSHDGDGFTHRGGPYFTHLDGPWYSWWADWYMEENWKDVNSPPSLG